MFSDGRAVDARHPARDSAPSRARPAHEKWFRCPVALGGAQFEMTFDASVLGRSLPRNDPLLFAYLAQQDERLLASIPQTDSTATQVRREVTSALASGEAQQSLVARRLAMTPRTMQRRLAVEGTSFAEIVEAVRRERAELLLSDMNLTASEVAFLLGFSEPAAFFRAFSRWTGETPQRWRAARRNG
jgi:AraC-like DNA-binding protein